MKIEEGKSYRTRDGRKATWERGPDSDGDLGFRVDMRLRLYKADGTHGGYSGCIIPNPNLDIVAEWEDTPAKPKTWGEMTDEERRDISFDAMCGKQVELGGDFGWQSWDQTLPLSETHQPIRIKPEVETVTLIGGKYAGSDWTFEEHEGHNKGWYEFRIKLQTKDGKLATGEFRNDNGDIITLEGI